jgi:glucose/arabinose dehydrogenase
MNRRPPVSPDTRASDRLALGNRVTHDVYVATAESHMKEISVKTRLTSLAVVATLCLGAESASATNLDNLQQMKTTGTPLSAMQQVPQTGSKADAIRHNLQSVTLPPGFKISLYALVPDARSIAVGPQGVATFVGTRKDKIYVLTDRARQGFADDVKEFAPSIPKQIPNALCFAKDGVLYSVERNRVLAYPAAEFFYESPDVAASVVVKEGELIPPEDESFNHTGRYCRIGPDNKLYITMGEPFNVPPPNRWASLQKAGVGTILRMDEDGTNREVYAYGVRNSVGLDFSPSDRSLWFTDNQVDGMGDDIPPGELNHATKIGENFGFPYYGGGHTRTVEYKEQTPPADVVFPVVEEVAHAADLGMSFYTGKMFPAAYQGAIFSAQHGSWNRTVPVGACIMVTFVKPDGSATQKPFAQGWLARDGSYRYWSQMTSQAQSIGLPTKANEFVRVGPPIGCPTRNLFCRVPPARILE